MKTDVYTPLELGPGIPHSTISGRDRKSAAHACLNCNKKNVTCVGQDGGCVACSEHDIKCIWPSIRKTDKAGKAHQISIKEESKATFNSQELRITEELVANDLSRIRKSAAS